MGDTSNTPPDEPLGDPPKRRSRRTVFEDFHGFDDQAQMETYLTALRETGTYAYAANAINCNPTEIADYRKREPEFQLLCDDALQLGNADFIAAARSRAIDGWENPIIGGRNRDEIVAHERRFSDGLMAMFLKRADQGFRDKSEVKIEANVTASFNYSNYSKRVRDQMRLLVQMIREDEAAVARGEELDMG